MHRPILGGVAAVGTAVALAACGGSDKKDAAVALPKAQAVSADCQGTPVQGGDLVYARANETQTLNPIEIRNGNGDIFADGLIYQGLVMYDPAGSTKILPALAESWTVSPDGKTYTFKLRSGVKFSNGDPVTAEDVKFSLDRFGDPKINAVMSPVSTGYKSSRIVDARTFEVKLSRPVPAFLDNIAIFPAFVVPKKLVEAQGEKFWRKPVGSGPFTVKEFVSGSHITFARNPSYWEKGKPYLNSVRFDFASDANSRLLSLTGGQAQIADTITPSQIQTVTGNPKLTLQAVDVPGWISLHPNEAYKPLADLKVRQAMAAALDRETINKAIFGGLGKIPNSVFGPLKYDGDAKTVPPYAFDLDKAKRLMAESGYPDGFTVELQYPAGLDYFNQLTLLMQQQLAKINVKLKLKQLASAAVTSNFSDRKFQLSFGYPEITSDVAVPDEYAGFYADPDGGTNGFFTGWKSPAIWAQVQEFTSEPDDAVRAQLWPKIQQALMDEQPTINVLNLPFLNAHAKNVCGTDVNDLGVDMLQNTWLASAK